MTILTHVSSPSYRRSAQPKASRDAYATGAPAEGLKVNRIARACGFAFTITLMTVALAGIIALKASIYLARFSF